MESLLPIRQKSTYKALVVFENGRGRTRVHITASTKKDLWEQLQKLFPGRVIDEIHITEHHFSVYGEVEPDGRYGFFRSLFRFRAWE